jgi:hypothetical protein
MYIIRDIFQLKFGRYKDAKELLEEARDKDLLPQAVHNRVLSDFTGDSYRLIFEEGYESLTDYERALTEGMAKKDWKDWYEKFKKHVRSSQREILKQVM